MTWPRFPRSHVGRQDVRQTWMTPGGGGGRSAVVAATPAAPAPMTTARPTATSPRAVTLVVAASDSSPAGKAFADFVCDGTADEVEIQAAIDALGITAGGRGGVVQLLEGQFLCSIGAVIDFSDANAVWLRGLGQQATNVSYVGPGTRPVVALSNEFNRVSDAFWNAHFTLGSGGSTRIHDNGINGAIYGDGLSQNSLRIFSNEINGFSPDGYSVDLVGGLTKCSVTDNNLAAIRFVGPATDNRGEHNEVSGNRGMNSPSYVKWHEYFTWERNNGWGTPNEFIDITEGTISCPTTGTILLTGCFGLTVHGSSIECSHDLVFTSCSECNFVANTVIGYTDDLADAATIKLVSCARVAVKSNIIRDNDGTHRPAYAVEVDAGCTDCCVTDNDAKGAYTTAAVHDLGTGTQTASGNR